MNMFHHGWVSWVNPAETMAKMRFFFCTAGLSEEAQSKSKPYPDTTKMGLLSPLPISVGPVEPRCFSVNM